MNNNKQKGFWLLVSVVISSILITVSSLSSYAATTNTQAKIEKVNNDQASTEENTSLVTSDEQNVEDDKGIADEAAYNKDPFEKFNRLMFTFNDTLDIYLMKPVAEVYNTILPKPVNQGIHNFFNNLGEVAIIANDVLQFNFYQGAKDTSRFVVNTTMGIGGLFDIATRMNLPYFQNDFGLTLAAWGYKDSSYLVLPFLGSNTIRDGIGMSVDYFEFSVYPYVEPQSRRYQLLGLFYIDHRANLLQFEPILEEAAIDKYVFMRNAYMQHRAYQIEQVKHLSFKEQKNNAGAAEISAVNISG